MEWNIPEAIDVKSQLLAKTLFVHANSRGIPPGHASQFFDVKYTSQNDNWTMVFLLSAYISFSSWLRQTVMLTEVKYPWDDWRKITNYYKNLSPTYTYPRDTPRARFAVLRRKEHVSNDESVCSSVFIIHNQLFILIGRDCWLKSIVGDGCCSQCNQLTMHFLYYRHYLLFEYKQVMITCISCT